MDYKEILTKKAYNLRSLIYTYKDKMSVEEFNSLKIMVDNAILSSDGRLDSLDYDARNSSIMEWNTKLDSSISSLKSRFEEKEKSGEQKE